MSVSDEAVDRVLDSLLDAAQAGEAWAVRELLDRWLGRPNVSDDREPEEIELEARVRVTEAARRARAEDLLDELDRERRPQLVQLPAPTSVDDEDEDMIERSEATQNAIDNLDAAADAEDFGAATNAVDRLFELAKDGDLSAIDALFDLEGELSVVEDVE